MTKNFTDLALAILRIGFSASMLTHGIPKISKLFETPIKFANPLGIGETPSLILALLGEVLCPLLILIGLKTKWAAIPAAITMFVAAFIIHAEDDFGTKEKALLYLFAFIAIFFAGAGKYSLDGVMKNK